MTTAHSSPSPTTIAMPTAKLALAEGVAVLGVGLLIGFVLLSSGRDLSTAGLAVGAAVGATLVGVAIGLLPSWLMGPRPAVQWAMPVLFAGMLRMFTALGAGVFAWMAYAPDKLGFWTTFLAVGVAALIAEVRVAITVIASATRSSQRHDTDHADDTPTADVVNA